MTLFSLKKNNRIFSIALFILAITSSLPIQAAGPITHAYLAKKYFSHTPKYGEAEKKAFMRGTLFPDIRYLGKISRNSTHYNPISLEEIKNEPSPFLAGVKYHSWVDIERNKYVESTTIKKQIPTTVDATLTHSYLKLIEEELVYKKEGWNDCCEYLYDISPEELDYQMEKETIIRWHGMLTLFFKSSPTTALSLLSLFGSGSTNFISREEAAKWATLLPTSTSDPVFIEYVESMLKNLEDKLSPAQ